MGSTVSIRSTERDAVTFQEMHLQGYLTPKRWSAALVQAGLSAGRQEHECRVGSHLSQHRPEPPHR